MTEVNFSKNNFLEHYAGNVNTLKERQIFNLYALLSRNLKSITLTLYT